MTECYFFYCVTYSLQLLSLYYNNLPNLTLFGIDEAFKTGNNIKWSFGK